MNRLSIFGLLALGSLLPSGAFGNDRAVDFQREIRPILSNRCFACHGPDEGSLEGGLRLDGLETASSPADSGLTAIVPGHSAESELVRRILSEDDSERMPPPNFGAALTSEESEKIKRWIDQGAPYAKHWSFDSVKSPKLEWSPIHFEGFEAWNNSPIDRFVFDKLLFKNWKPSPRADKRTLLRRVTLDLTGLPPTPEELILFEQDDALDGYERRVNELLASPAFGEHWARKWLDMARYADSAGYADDPLRTIWAYRDWVIQAINHGMPFDQFTVEQIAGDLLDSPTEEQLIATAFHRNTLTNNEGGTNDEEFRNVAVVDRVNTTMAVWMGVTMACAQCHTHKYDPITQAEYFQLFAIFNQSQDADRTDESPVLEWFPPELREKRLDLQQESERVLASLNAPDPSLETEQRDWESKMATPIPWNGVHPKAIATASGMTASVDENGAIEVDGRAEKDVFTIEWTVETVEDLRQLQGIAVETNPMLASNQSKETSESTTPPTNFVLTDVKAQVIGNANNPLSARFVRIELPGSERILSLAEVQVFRGSNNIALQGIASQSSEGFGGAATRAVDGNTDGDYNKNSVTHTQISDSPWWEVDLNQLHPVDSVVLWNRTDGPLQNRLNGAVVKLLDENRKVVREDRIENASNENHINLVPSVNLGLVAARASFQQSGFEASRAIDTDLATGWAVGGQHEKPQTLWLQTKAIGRDTIPEAIHFPAVFRLGLAFQSPHTHHVPTSLRVLKTSEERLAEWMSTPSPVLAILNQPKEDRTADSQKELQQFYTREVALARQPLRDRRVELQRDLDQVKPVTTVPVMRERSAEQQRETFVQLRGNYRTLGDKVEPSLPQAFHSYSSQNEPRKLDRKDLAHWLMQDDNPLTARVVANRYWEELFGTGIVRTSEEFGSQGDLPTHPELLDYLATDLIRLEWDTKAFLRELVMSQAYQQISTVSQDEFERDPDNAYVSRGPRVRASSEVVRDMTLAASGLLSRRFYGPPVRPPQPNLGLNAAFGSRTDWETSSGENRYRRALYTQWRRSNPYPSMATFDAPNREVCILKRDRTNTPLQALVTLNDPAFVEAAQALSRRVAYYEFRDEPFETKLTQIFLLAIGREPTERETKSLRSLFDVAMEEFQNAPKQAVKLASEPLGAIPKDASAVELASWTAICNILFNLDEFLMKP